VRERFRDGWLTFDCGTETRRIAPVPQAWREKSDLELIALLGAAERAARPRKQ